MTQRTAHYSITKAAIPTPKLVDITPDNYNFYTPLCHNKPTLARPMLLTTNPTKVTCKKCLRSLK